MTAPFPWQAPQWDLLWSMCRQGRLPHALLLCGPLGLGVSEFARALAAALLCLSPCANGAPCRACRGCILANAGTHPEYWVCSPEGEAKQIRVDQLRALAQVVSLKRQLSRVKVVIVDPANAMNRYAMNAILKTLEEPPPETVFILVSDRATALPATVRSRCQRVDLAQGSRTAMLAWLAERLDGGCDLELALRFAGNRPLAALALIEGGGLELRRNAIAEFMALRSGAADPVEVAAAWAKGDAEQIVCWLLTVVEDLITIRLAPHAHGLVNLPARDDLEALAGRMTLCELYSAHDRLAQAVRLLRSASNVAPLNLYEELTINWCAPTTAALVPHDPTE